MRGNGARTAFAIVAVTITAAGCASSPAPAPRTASPVSSQELKASCQAMAAGSSASAAQLTYATAEALVGTEVPVCIVPKPGHDGVPRLEHATAAKTQTPGWAAAVAFDQPLPSGVAVSLSNEAYVYVDGAWLLARMTGVGTNA